MTSFGENSLTVYSRIIGQVRVLDVHHGLAVFPRLTLRLGVALQESPDDQFSDGRPIRAFEMRDLRGELRLEEHGKALGLLHWAGPRRHVRSAPYISESQVEVVCDLDWPRVERIEEHRAGAQALLWLALWPTLTDVHGYLDCEIGTIRADVPRDKWIAVLTSLEGVRRSLVEVVHAAPEAPEFDAAMGHLSDAGARILRGDYDEAAAACRRAIESISSALDVPSDAGALEAALEAACGAERAKAYSGIVARLKALGNLAVHRPDAAGRYTRAEALFIVGATQQAAALLATLLRRRQR